MFIMNFPYLGMHYWSFQVTGLAVHGDKLLVTSNDSRIRMYDLRDMALTCKFKVYSNKAIIFFVFPFLL